jgi:hypothetical protein
MKNVLQEVLVAYKDAHEIPVSGERNLNFKASAPVDAATFLEIMKQATPGGYNAFDEDAARRVVTLFQDAEYTIAREGSPAVYVKPKTRVWLDRQYDIRDLADEVSFEKDGTFRIWWD